MLLSSDDIRAALPRNQSRHGSRVFAVMAAMLAESLRAGVRVVLDSTGMSARFRAILREQRSIFCHIHLRLERVETFQQRECRRTDRRDAPVPRTAFFHSARVGFQYPPDLSIATDDLTVPEVYEIALRYLASLSVEPKDT